VQVNQLFPTGDLPSRSMLTGLLGAALGVRKHEGHRLNALASHISYAARTQGEPRVMEDFHIADLGRNYMQSDKAWSTSGARTYRSGSVTQDKVLQRKEYLADSSVIVAVRIEERAGVAPGPTTAEARVWAASISPAAVVGALQKPAFPLFIGRKTCVPSRPIVEAVTDAEMIDAVGFGAKDGYTLCGHELPGHTAMRRRTRAEERGKVVFASGEGVERMKHYPHVWGARGEREMDGDFARGVGVSVIVSINAVIACKQLNVVESRA